MADVAAALEQRPASERRLRRNLKVLAFGTMFYGIVGVIMIAIQLIINGRSDGPLLLVGAVALGTAIPGLTFWTMGFIFGDEWRVGSRRKDASPDELYAFIRFWIVLESAIRTVYSGNFGESRASSPLITMLLNMKKAGFIDSWSFDRLNEMRGLRNKIVHGERAVVARNELTELVRDGREILNRLSRNSGSVRDSASS
ncbi:hypothetical protein [Streptomyces sp. NPDC005732]|uniref:hypothetical protein n=1 Tax=Streptomyces sp. NPDC005732 TaxID=3157057 RepID=UPI00340B8208